MPIRRSYDDVTSLSHLPEGIWRKCRRSVENITEALWESQVSSGTVSRLSAKIYYHIEAWRNREIAGERQGGFGGLERLLKHLKDRDKDRCAILDEGLGM